MRRVVIVTLLLVVSMAEAIPVEDTTVTDPAVYFVNQVGKNVNKKISQFIVNEMKFSYVRISLENKEEAERYLYFLRRLERWHAKLIVHREVNAKGFSSPLFVVGLPGKNKKVIFSVDYLLPVSSATSKKKVKKLFKKLYRDAATSMGILSILKFIYCMGWITPESIGSLLSKSNFFFYLLYKLGMKKALKNLSKPKKREEYCEPVRLVEAIKILKPMAGFSFTTLKKVDGKWVVTGFSAPEMKFENFLPFMVPGKYYLPVTIPEIRGCGELLDVVDVRSFRGLIAKENLSGKLKLVVSEEEPDYMLDCVARNYKEKGWMEYEVKKMVDDMKNSLSAISQNVSPYLEGGNSYIPVLTGNENDFTGMLSNVGSKVSQLIDNIDELGKSLPQNVKIFFAGGSKGGMAIVTTGKIKVHLGRFRKTYTTVMLLEMR